MEKHIQLFVQRLHTNLVQGTRGLVQKLVCLFLTGLSTEMVIAQDVGSGVLLMNAVAVQPVQNFEPRIILYPNPVQEKLMVEVTDTQSDWYFIKLYRDNGKELETIRVNQQKGTETVVMDMKKYSRGIYFVSVISQTKVRSYRIQKE